MAPDLTRRRHPSSFPLTRRIAAAAAIALAAAAAVPLPAVAQVPEDPALKEVENSKFSTAGVIVSNAVYVRCGPGDNYYPTMKLDKGAKVKVVGAKFDWLKVVPPDGSFCYVARLYVDRHGDGTVGRVNKDSINVRAGSSLSALKIGILCELSQGQDVEILGEEQEYFKIKPPAGAYLYIAKKFVEPDPDAKPEVQAAAPKAVVPAPAPVPPTEIVKNDPPVGTPVPTPTPAPAPELTKPVAEAPKPVDAPKPEPVVADTPKPLTTDTPAPAPAPIKPTVDVPNPEALNITPAPAPAPSPTPEPEVVKPVEPAKPVRPQVDVSTPELAEAVFDKAEAQFQATRTQPLDQQPIDALLYQFQATSGSDGLPETLRRIADNRIATLKIRAGAQKELLAARSAQSEMRQKQLALEAEQAELIKRINENSLKVFTAVGTLQPSSLQQGQGTLYRVTDPSTGRTIAYLRTNDPKVLPLIGQFVGVKGALKEETRIGAKVIASTEVIACDPAKVHQSITAQIIPPSLMPREPAQATTDPQPQQ